MERKNQEFKCDEICQYDRQINQESYEKIQEWIKRYSEIKVGDIVEAPTLVANNSFIVTEIDLYGESSYYSFEYTILPLNKKNKPILNRKKIKVDTVSKDGIIYDNPSYFRQKYTAAQLRFKDYYYAHRRNDTIQ